MPGSNILLQTKRSPQAQQALLDSYLVQLQAAPFDQAISDQVSPFHTTEPLVMQMNLGKMCNQTCKHCHVDAGPTRKEIMTQATMQACLDALAKTTIPVVDLTGGAPEMNPHFRWLVTAIKALNRHVIVRCNLTILLANPKYADLPNFYAQHGIEVVSSLPHFSGTRTDAQRGKGVFAQSIQALQRLNAVGYGQLNTGLILNLVHNPSGAFLPGSQPALEQTFKKELKRKFDIVFNDLLAITNMPIARFLDYLEDSGNLEDYLKLLVSNYNPQTVQHLMCKTTLSIGWEGSLYDCDFNQMLEIPCHGVRHIQDLNPEQLVNRPIQTGLHCYGCTAGSGSSCGGTLT